MDCILYLVRDTQLYSVNKSQFIILSLFIDDNLYI